MTASLAPPCRLPRSVPMPVAMQEWKFESVDAVTRAAKVEALNSCSAYSVSEMSNTRRAPNRGVLAVQQVEEMAGDGIVLVESARSRRLLRPACGAGLGIGAEAEGTAARECVRAAPLGAKRWALDASLDRRSFGVGAESPARRLRTSAP